MKKLIVVVLAMLTMGGILLKGTSVHAINIDEATARQYGAYYLSVMLGAEVADENDITLVYKFMNEEQHVPSAYVFNIEKQGFIIVSGSDLWYPILGYSTEGLLDTSNMAPSFKWYFEGLCEYISYSQNTGISLINDIEDEWNDLRYEKLCPIKHTKASEWLMDNKWGQGSVYYPTYNKMCPYKDQDGYRMTAYVGCVATAMSQIMHYWKYPIEPVEDYMGLSCYIDGYYFGYVDIDMRGISYDFDHMPNMLDDYSTEREIDATALLCYHAGISVQMNYGTDGSSAYSYKVPSALRDIFLYDTVIEYVSRAKDFNGVSEIPVYTNEEWVEILTTEIEAGRPIYYSGYSNSGSGRDAGGHAFVCDGKHSSNGMFHFNWGWDGEPNMWCDVRNNDLEVWGYDFNLNQKIVRFIQPRPEPAPEPEPDPDPEPDPEPDEPEGISTVDVDLKPAYPNPATTQITISYQLNSQSKVEMDVYSIEGKLMEKIVLNEGEHAISLDVSNYPQGVYFYRIGTLCEKFIVN